MREFSIYWLNAESAKLMRQQWKESGAPLGNSYYWIQYKNGSTVVFDESYDKDHLPLLTLNDVLYVSTWFSAEHGGYGDVFINERLSHNEVQDIITSELYDEDWNMFYDKINFHKLFPYEEYEPFRNYE